MRHHASVAPSLSIAGLLCYLVAHSEFLLSLGMLRQRVIAPRALSSHTKAREERNYLPTWREARRSLCPHQMLNLVHVLSYDDILGRMGWT